VICWPLRKETNVVIFVMRCTTFQDGSNWSIIESVCEPRSTPSSVKIGPIPDSSRHEWRHAYLMLGGRKGGIGCLGAWRWPWLLHRLRPKNKFLFAPPLPPILIFPLSHYFKQMPDCPNTSWNNEKESCHFGCRSMRFNVISTGAIDSRLWKHCRYASLSL
jgi:hypothetical protein